MGRVGDAASREACRSSSVGHARSGGRHAGRGEDAPLPPRARQVARFARRAGQPRGRRPQHPAPRFTVPAGVDRLLASDAWPGPGARVGVTLIDPNGTYAAYTRPQGNGNHGQVDVRDPVAGTWTAIVFLRDGTFTGTVHLEFATQRFGAVDSVTPGSLTLQPGQTGRLRVHVNLPQSPGDSDHDLVISNSSADRTVVPVILRSLVSVDGHGASFTGTLTGGNGRP